MRTVLSPRKFLGAAVVVGLLFVLACGSAEEDPTPTQRPADTPTSVAVPTLVLPTATATPIPPQPGVTAAPTATNTPAPPTPTPLPGDEPQYGGSVTVPGNCGPLDANHSQTGFCWNGLGWIGNIYNGLIRVNPVDRVTVEGDLAEAWSVSGDGTEYTFNIRPGVVDHEGNPYTAEDAAYQLIRYEERPNGINPRRQGCIQAYVADILDDNGNPVANPGAEAIDSSTLVIRLDAPRAAFVSCISGAWSAFLPDTYTSQIDDPMVTPDGYRDLDFAKGEAIGTGPFKVVNHEIDNITELERHDQFFRDGFPYLDGYTSVFIPDAAVRVANFRAGRIDALGVFDNQPSKSDAEELQRAVGDDLVAPLINAMGWRGIQLNLSNAPFGPIGDPTADKIRTAIQMGFDRQEMSKLNYDGIGTLATPYFFYWDWIATPDQWFEALPGFDPDPMVREEQLAAAQALMQEAGYGPDNLLPVEAVVTTGSQNEAEIQGQWLRNNLYLDVTTTNMGNTSALRARTNPGDFQMIAVESVGASFADPDAFNLGVFFTDEEGGRNFTSWVNDDWRALHEQQLVLNDPAERGPVLFEMAKILYADAALVGNNRPALVHGWRGNWRGYVAPIIHASNMTLEHVWLAE